MLVLWYLQLIVWQWQYKFELWEFIFSVVEVDDDEELIDVEDWVFGFMSVVDLVFEVWVLLFEQQVVLLMLMRVFGSDESEFSVVECEQFVDLYQCDELS